STWARHCCCGLQVRAFWAEFGRAPQSGGWARAGTAVRAIDASRRTTARFITRLLSRLTPGRAVLFGPAGAEGRQHLGGEGVQGVPVVGALAEGDVDARAAGVAEAGEHLEVLLGGPAQPAGALIALRAPVLAEDLLAAL